MQNSFLSEDEKHPLILPAKHHVTKLLIFESHLALNYGGLTLVHSHLLRRYRIVRGRNLIRQIVRNCVRCTRFNAKSLQQMMAPLPAIRLRPSRPFTYTGVDFAGPFMIRASGGRGQKAFKGYVSIFVCLVVKAVHIEVFSNLYSAALWLVKVCAVSCTATMVQTSLVLRLNLAVCFLKHLTFLKRLLGQSLRTTWSGHSSRLMPHILLACGNRMSNPSSDIWFE